MTPEVFMTFATPVMTLAAVLVSHLMTQARDEKAAAAAKTAHDETLNQVRISSEINAQQSAALTVGTLAPAIAKIANEAR